MLQRVFGASRHGIFARVGVLVPREIGFLMRLEDGVNSRRLIVPMARYRDERPRQVVILEHGRNPTTDYYIRPRFALFGKLRTQIIDISTTDPATISIGAGTFVVIVRYLNDAWARCLRRYRDRFCGVAYFIDDDLPAALLASGLPLKYRYKILKLFFLQRASLSLLSSEIWVSTAYLAEKYGLQSSAVVEPVPLIEEPTRERMTTYFYTGTMAHWHEFLWLSGLVRAVQQRSPDLTFITFGGNEVRQLFRGIPRVLCIHPVSWPTFLESLPAVKFDIGLAPLLEGSFNKGRSHTKFFDITRLGAVGLYSHAPPYAEFVRQDVDGMLIDNDPDRWCSVILELAAAPARRAEMLDCARSRLRLLVDSRERLFA